MIYHNIGGIIKEEKEITTPMLLLSGEFDPVTPFSWATELKSHGKTAWSKEWKGISHVVSWSSDCSGEVARDFLEAPYLDPFIADCVNDESEFRFKTN